MRAMARRTTPSLLVLVLSATAVLFAAAQSTSEPWPDPSNFTNITPGFVKVPTPSGVSSCNKTIARITTINPTPSGFYSAGSFQPPSTNSTAGDCPTRWSRIKLALSMQTEDVEGYQRAVGVFIKGVEVMRVRMEWTNTNKTYFRAEADVTKYASIFRSTSPLPITIGFDSPPTSNSSARNVTAECTFYGTSSHFPAAALGSTFVPDVVVPIVYDATTGKRWGEPNLSTRVANADIPPNPFKAQIEVYASRPPEDESSIITFGQVVVFINNNAVGHAYAPNVEFTHTAVIPTFTLLAGPFVGVLAEPRAHNFSFRSPESTKVLVGANLLVWLAKGVASTSGQLILAHHTPLFDKTLVDQPAPAEYNEQGGPGPQYYAPAYAEAWTEVLTSGFVQVGSKIWDYSNGQLAVAHVFDNKGLFIYEYAKNRLYVESGATQKRSMSGQDPVETDDVVHTYVNDHVSDCHRELCGLRFTDAYTIDFTNILTPPRDPLYTSSKYASTTLSHTYTLDEVTQGSYDYPITTLEHGDYENDILFDGSYCYNYTSHTHANDELSHQKGTYNVVRHTSTTVSDNFNCY
eukprot:jgi/Chlat1/1150/Chrsp112S01624